MVGQQLRIQLIELIALLFPFLTLVLRLTITEMKERESSQGRLSSEDFVLIGGGFSIIFLIWAAIILINATIRAAGIGFRTEIGLSLTFILLSLVTFGAITLVFISEIVSDGAAGE